MARGQPGARATSSGPSPFSDPCRASRATDDHLEVRYTSGQGPRFAEAPVAFRVTAGGSVTGHYSRVVERGWRHQVSSRAPEHLRALEVRLVERLCAEFGLTASVPARGDVTNVYLHPDPALGRRRVGILRVTNGHFYADGDRSKVDDHARAFSGVAVAEGKYLSTMVDDELGIDRAVQMVALAMQDRTPQR